MLPAPPTSFVGRDAELDALVALVRSSRLVTVTGAAGMGKTRLAIEVAGRLRDTAAARFAGLAALTDAALVAQEVASCLGLREEADQTLARTLVTHTGALPILLVLDNCEHVVDACAALIDELLRGCVNLRVVATSLRPLRVPGEVVWRIAPLSVPGPRSEASAQTIAASEAARLFEARARYVRPGFTIDPTNAGAIALVCRRLEGVPLAIELAAARMERVSVADLSAELERRFTGLGEAPARRAASRHRTLRAALDWGHGLLDDRERRLFRRLSVFGGSFDLAAAEAVCAGAGLESGQVGGLVFRLVESSLLTPDTDRQGPARYRLLETVRHYGAERLAESGERPAVAAAHAAYFLTLAAEAARAEQGPDQPAWLERLQSELDNLRLALDWCRTHDAGSWLRLGSSLSWFWVTRGHFREGFAWLEGALERAPAGAPWRPDGLLAAARLSFWRGDYTAARSRCETCLEACGEDARVLAPALMLLGSVLASLGEWAESRRRFEAALSAAGDQVARLEAMVGFGEMLLQAGDLAGARLRLEEVTALSRGPEAPRGRAALFLGLADLLQGDAGRARARLERSLAIFERLGNRYAAGAALDGLAAVAVTESEPERALRLSGAAAAMRAAIGAQLAPRWRELLRVSVLDPARAAAGERADAVWAEGADMEFEEAVRYARADGRAPAAAPAEPAAARPPGDLTPRELEVAELVALGLTNREIAARLVIAERTVEGHVERIRAKLRVRSRTRIGPSLLRMRAWPPSRPSPRGGRVTPTNPSR